MFLGFYAFVVLILMENASETRSHHHGIVHGPNKRSEFVQTTVKPEPPSVGPKSTCAASEFVHLKGVLEEILEKLNSLRTTESALLGVAPRSTESAVPPTSVPSTAVSSKASTESSLFLFDFKKRSGSTPNPKWGAWTSWSSCSVSCGKGRKIRWRHCVEACVAETEMQEKTCQLPACAPTKIFGIKL